MCKEPTTPKKFHRKSRQPNQETVIFNYDNQGVIMCLTASFPQEYNKSRKKETEIVPKTVTAVEYNIRIEEDTV